MWESALDNHAILKKLSPVQRSTALRIILAYQIIATGAVLVLTRVPPRNLFAKERQEAFLLCNERFCANNEQENACVKHALSARSFFVTHIIRTNGLNDSKGYKKRVSARKNLLKACTSVRALRVDRLGAPGRGACALFLHAIPWSADTRRMARKMDFG